ncbi:MAG: hypothetical protein ABI397_03415 [Candidatus Saccharimonas sp.]
MGRTFYLDLDRTLFRTDEVESLFRVVEVLYPDNAKVKCGYEDRKRFYVVPDSEAKDDFVYHHDFVWQLQDAGLDVDTVLRQLRARLGDGRFEYSGAKQLVDTLKGLGEVKILTYGETVYQCFKVSLCPSLTGLEKIAILEPKEQYLNKHALRDDFIVDDKQMSGITNGMRVIRIQHDPAVPADAHSLEEVLAIISDSIALITTP